MSVNTALALIEAERRRKRDPLALFRFASEAQRKLVRYVREGNETLFRSGNSAGKTYIGAAMAISMLRGKRDLAGEPLPDVPTPCTGWCMVQSYKGQVDGAQAAVLQCLGDWPHKIVWVRSEAQGWIDTLYVATGKCTHGTDEKCKTCSKLVFHCAESDSGVGGRVHFVWADEPPKKETWDECRQRGTATRRLFRFITATPKEKYWWGWMPADFYKCEDKPRDGFVEIRSSMMDNKAILPEVLKEKLEGAAKDQRARAVIYGDYVDLKGECPFPPDKLEMWMKRKREPKVERVTILAERRTIEGDIVVPVTCAVQVFHDPDPEEAYVGVLDAASFLRLDPITGIVAKDWTREGSSARGVPDPCGLHIYARRKPKLVARFIGYCGGHGLGSLGAILARRYGNALLDVDLTGGYGEATVRALTDSHYYYLNNFDRSAANPYGGGGSLGFKMQARNRAEMVAAIQQALLDDSLICESEEAIKSLQEVTYVMTPSGKERPEASYGAKDEDMICMGRALHLMNVLPLPGVRHVSATERLNKMAGFRLIRHRTVNRSAVKWNPS